ncbi:MAG: T9SS type A sorting domain-containing protein [Flavobacteriales bacterium]|nr:T9SS type A sorting domain-containing protein [Flavobacteriales bacterium]
MFRTTAAGDSIRFKNFGAPAFNAMGVAEDDDENLFLAGYAETADINFNNNCYIIKCTPEGDVLWWRSRPRESWFTHVIAVADGVVAIGYWRQNAFGEAVAFAMKYSTDGDVLWERNLQVADNTQEPCQMNDGFEDADGNLILCGTVENYNNVFNDKGLLFKLSPDGEVVWGRDYAHYGGQNGYHPQVFNAVQPTSDGGFILTGETWGPMPPNPSRLWLLKLDSVGCLVPGCNTVGVEEFESQLQSALHMSPNPASEHLQERLALPEGYRLEGTVQALLLDAQGREVLREQVPTNTTELRGTMDVNGLPTGLYYLHLRDGQKWLAGGKVVVE